MAKEKRCTIEIPKEVSIEHEIALPGFDVIVNNNFKILFGDFIADDLIVEGNLYVDCDLRVKSLTVKGNLEVGCCIYADTVIVEGNLEAESIKTNGDIRVNGNLYTAIFECGGDLTVKGNIEAECISLINGNCHVDGDITYGETREDVAINGDVYCGGLLWLFDPTTIKGNLEAKKICAVDKITVDGNLTTNDFEFLDDCVINGDFTVNGDVSDERDYAIEEDIPVISLTVKGKYNVSGELLNDEFIKLII